jgi:hypothetical protein
MEVEKSIILLLLFHGGAAHEKSPHDAVANNTLFSGRRF